MFCSKNEFDKFANQKIVVNNCEQRRLLCGKLAALINMKNNKIQNRQVARLHSYQEKQIYITTLIHSAGVQPGFLPQNVRGKIKFDFAKILGKINTILLSQYLQKSNNCLEKWDIISIQEWDQDLSEIIRKLKNEQKVNNKFVLREGILFKQNLVYKTQVYLLCLPENLSREILFVMHTNNSAHMNLVNLRLNFKDNF